MTANKALHLTAAGHRGCKRRAFGLSRRSLGEGGWPPSLTYIVSLIWRHRASRLSSTMKTIAIATFLAVLATGCSSSRFPTRYGVHEQETNEFMFVSGDGKKEWYSVLEFDRIARRYASWPMFSTRQEWASRPCTLPLADTGGRFTTTSAHPFVALV
jgi:hypothetical protein